MTHTPGPWMWDSDPVKNDPYQRIRYRVVARGKTITQVYYSSFEGGLTNAEADARLIAESPNLLKLLKEARYTFEMWKDVAPAVSLCADIDAAIKKAEGG